MFKSVLGFKLKNRKITTDNNITLEKNHGTDLKNFLNQMKSLILNVPRLRRITETIVFTLQGLATSWHPVCPTLCLLYPVILVLDF